MSITTAPAFPHPRTTDAARRGRGATRATRPAQPVTGAPALTAEGRARLNERVRRLREETLVELRPLLVEWQRDERVVADFERAQSEIDRLELLLAEAEDLSADPERFDGRAELGSRVEVEMPDGERTWVRLVHPEEAFLDDERISSTSPMAVALLGARAGHTVWVAAPAGPWPCRVVTVEPPRA